MTSGDLYSFLDETLNRSFVNLCFLPGTRWIEDAFMCIRLSFYPLFYGHIYCLSKVNYPNNNTFGAWSLA